MEIKEIFTYISI